MRCCRLYHQGRVFHPARQGERTVSGVYGARDCGRFFLFFGEEMMNFRVEISTFDRGRSDAIRSAVEQTSVRSTGYSAYWQTASRYRSQCEYCSGYAVL